MKFEKLVSDIENYKNSSQLSIEQVIGMVQDLCKDLGISVEQCSVENTDDMIRKLNWLSNLSIGIFKQQNALIKEHRLLSRATKMNDAVIEIQQESNAIVQAMQEKEKLEKAREQERLEAERIEEEIRLLQKELDKEKKQIDDLVFALTSVRNNLAMKDSQRQQAFSQYEQKQLELDNVIEKQKLLRQQMKEKQLEIDKIKEENAKCLYEDIPAAENALQRQRDVQEAQKKTVKDNQAILEQLEKEIITVRQWITQTEISFKEKKREKEEWQKRKEKLAARKEALHDEISGLNEACQAVQNEIHQLEDILHATQPDEILRKRQEQKQELESLIEDYRRKKEELEAENGRLSEKEKEINVLQNDIIRKKSEIQKAEVQLNRIRQDAEALQTAFDNLSKTDYLRQVNELKEKCSFLMEIHSNLKKDFQAYGMHYEPGQFVSEEELAHILKDMNSFLNSYSNHIKSCLEHFSVRNQV